MYDEYDPSTVAKAVESGRLDELLDHLYIMDTRPVVQAAVESRRSGLG